MTWTVQTGGGSTHLHDARLQVVQEKRCTVRAGAGGFRGQLHAAAAAAAAPRQRPRVFRLSKGPPEPLRWIQIEKNWPGQIRSALLFQYLQGISWKKL